MSIRNLFTPEEWRILQFTPLWVFQLMAEAVAYRDSDELLAFEYMLQSSYKIREPLLYEVLQSISEEFSNVNNLYSIDECDCPSGLEKMVEILETRSDSRLGHDFKIELFGLAQLISEPLVQEESNYQERDKFLLKREGMRQVRLKHIREILRI